jgi:hypothetical protein
MKYRYRPAGLLCELVKRVNGNLLCVECGNHNHYLSYPAEMWEAA